MLGHKKVAALVVLAVLFGAVQSVPAQRMVRLNSAPIAFRSFFRKFASAVNTGSGPQIAAMTSFPFKYGFDAGDEGTWDRKQFLKNYGTIFLPQPLVFKERNPSFTVQGTSYTAMANSDDASYFTFKKQGGTYKLVSYIVEP